MSEFRYLSMALERSTRLLQATIEKDKNYITKAFGEYHREEYPKKLSRFSREIVLLGINYNKDAKDIQYEVELEGVRRGK